MLSEDNEQDILASRLEDPKVRAQMVRILDRLDLVEDIITSNSAIHHLQTEGMVERLSERIEKAILLIDQLSAPHILGLVKELEKYSPTIMEFLSLLSEFEKTGRLSNLMDLLQGAKAINDILNDSMIDRMAIQLESISGTLEKLRLIPLDDLLNVMSRLRESGVLDTMPEIAGSFVALNKLMTDSLLERAMTLFEQGIAYQNSISTAIRMIPETPERSPGLVGLWSLMRDPETQKSLYIVLTAIKAVLTQK